MKPLVASAARSIPAAPPTSVPGRASVVFGTPPPVVGVPCCVAMPQCYLDRVSRSSGSQEQGLVPRTRRTFELVKVLAPRELRVRYRQSVLDIAWALISPVAILVVYGLVLTQSFDVEGTCGPYLSSAWIGLVLWTFVATAIGTATVSLISSAGLITKVYFPREALPLAMVGAALADLAIGLLTVFVLLPLQGVDLGWPTLSIVLPLALVIIWAAAVSVFAGVLAAFIRDVPHAVSLALRVGFFATPVMYEQSFTPPALAWTASVNPLAVAIDAFRQATMCGQWPDVPLLIVHLVVGTLLLGLAIAYTRSVEARVTDVV